MSRVTQYTYDTLSRPYQLFNPAIQTAALVQRTYTPDSKLANLTDANSNTTDFTYDGFDRLATTTYPDSSTETAAYDADSNVLTRKTRAGATIVYTYDSLNRLHTKQVPSGPLVTFGYDLDGRQVSVGDTSSAVVSVAATGGTPAYATSYAYDALNRPTGTSWSPALAATAPSAVASVVFTHSYNKVNQRTGQSVSDNSWISYPSGTSTTSYTANNLNQYTAVGTVTPTYDGNGNLTSDGTYSFGYDAENRLVSAAGAGNTSSYAYDGRGRRKSRTVNGATTISVTDAQNREVLEYDGSSGAILRWYAYGLGANALLNQTDLGANTRATFVPDIQSSIIGLMDAGSATLVSFAYRPYGGTGAAPAQFGYTGQRIDLPAGGLYYYRARHYSPAWGRFLQADPAGYSAGPNLYAYVANDPLNGLDPDGLFFASLGNAALGTAQAVGSFTQLAFQPEIDFYKQSIVQPFYAGVNYLANSPLGDPNVYMSMGAAGAPEIAVASGIRFLAGLAGAAEEAEVATTTVGRYMSQAELDAMTTSGRVQESFNNGVTSVTVPPNPGLYRAAPATDIFTQFDVPTSSLNGVGTGTAKIYGPNSIFGPRLGITEMPPATNIVVP